MIETDVTATQDIALQSLQGQHTLRLLTVLYQASLAINRARSETEVVEALSKQLSYGEFDVGMIVLFRDKSEPRGEVCSYWDRSPNPATPNRWVKSSIFNPSTTIFNDIASNNRLRPAARKRYTKMGIYSIAQIPIAAQNSLLGMLMLQTRNEFHFSPEYIHPYEMLAAQAATALEKQRLLAAEQQRSEELSSLVAISQTFASITNRRQTMGELTSRIADALGAQRCLVALYDPETKEMVGQAPAHGVPDEIAQTFRYPADGKLKEKWNLREQGSFITNAPSTDVAPSLQVFVESFEVHSLLVVPMQSEGRTLGALFAANKPDGFASRDAQLATVFAGQAANVIRNAQIYQEQQQRTHEMEVLNQIAVTVGSSLALDEILQETLQSLSQAMDYDMALVALWDQNQNNMSLAAAYQVPSKFEAALRKKGMNQTLCAITARQGSVYREPDIATITQVPTEALIKLGYRSYLGAPLLAEGRVLGTLCAFSKQPNHFTPTNVKLIAAVSPQVGLAVRNALSFEETQQRAMQIQTAGEISRAALSEQDAQKLLQSTVDLIRYRFGYYHVSVFLLDQAREWAVVQASTGDVGREMMEKPHRLEIGGQSIVGKVVDSGEAHIALDVGEDAKYFNNPLLPQTRSEMALPLIDRGQVLGALDVQSTQPSAFTKDDVTILQTMTDQVAIALRNTQLLEQVEAVAQRAESRANQLATLLRVIQQVQVEKDLKEQIQLITEGVVQAKLYQQATLSVLDDDWQTIQEYSGYAGLTNQQIEQLKSLPPPSREERARRFHERFRIGNSFYIPAGQDPVLNPVGVVASQQEIPEHSEWHPQDMVLVPLWMGNKLVGVFSLDHPFDGRVPTKESLLPLELFANLAAWVIENSQLLSEAQRRTVQLQTAADISRAASSVLDLETLYSETLELIRERFNYSYVGLFLTDEAQKWAILRAGTGEAGQMMLQTGHRLEVSGKSMIGKAIAAGEAQIMQDIAMATSYLANPFLEETKSEMAVPLIARGQVLGAITVQSTAEGVFGEQDISILQTIADQFANTISNAALFEQLQKSVADGERVYRQYIRQEWDVQALAKSSEGRSGYEYDLQEVRPVDQIGSPDPETIQAQDPEILTTPLVLGGEIIGSIGIAPESSDYHWSDDEIAIVNAVAEQVTQAMESAYHSEQSERRAAQMAAAAEIGQAVSSVMTAGEVMQTAVNTISSLFGLYHVAIYLIDESGDIISLKEATGHAGEVMKESNYYLSTDDQALIAQAIQDRHAQIALDVDETRAWQQNPLLPDSRSEMAIPLMAAGQVLGAINIHATQAAAFDQVDATVFQTVADQIASTLESARLFEETRQSAADQQMLFDVTTAAVTTAELDDMLQRVADTIYSRMGGTNVGILMVDREQDMLVMRASSGFEQSTLDRSTVPVGRGITGWVALTGEPVILTDVRESTHYIAGDSRTLSELAVPILVDQYVAGVINIESHDLDAFDEQDLRLLQTLSGTLGAIIKSFTLVSELQAANQQLQEVDALKSQFLANMSHELRTPLNSIIGFSRVILKGIDGPITDMQKQDLTSIHNSGRHLLGLINDLLDHSKIEAGKMQIDAEITSVIEMITGVMSTAIGLTKDKPVELLQEVPPDLPEVWGDPFRLRQVLLNLVSNAAKFTDEGSITVRATYDDEAVQVDVIDTGTGISEEDQGKLFKAFSQVDASSTRKVGGSGLGLAISAQLMQLQGGRIWVESGIGLGSTFSMAIPRLNADGNGPIRDLNIEAPEEEDIAEQAEAKEAKVVLSVDDEQGVIDLFHRYLSREGYQVEGVINGAEALNRAIELADKLVAITIDILMPEMDGWEIVRQLRNNPITSNIPIIICSIKLDQALAKEYNVEHYLVKPILQDDLLNAVKEYDKDSKRKV